jgi:hypothetical protein
MLVVVSCPKCQKQSNVPDTSVGKRIRCSGCQAIYLVPRDDAAEPPPSLRTAAPPPLPRQSAPEDDEPNYEPNYEPDADAAPEPPGPQAPPSRLGYWAAVIGIGLLMVACGILAAVYLNK